MYVCRWCCTNAVMYSNKGCRIKMWDNHIVSAILFFFPQISNSFESLSLLTDIPINLKSNPQKALKSLYEYNDSICEIWFYKNKKDTMHTEVRFKLSQNLSELYSFLSSFEREVAIRCSPYIYKFKSNT